MRKKHKWTKEDNILAFFLYKDKSDIDITKKFILKYTNISPNSLKMKFSNFKFLEGKRGLEHASKDSKEVYKDYKNNSEELRKKCLKILDITKY